MFTDTPSLPGAQGRHLPVHHGGGGVPGAHAAPAGPGDLPLQAGGLRAGQAGPAALRARGGGEGPGEEPPDGQRGGPRQGDVSWASSGSASVSQSSQGRDSHSSSLSEQYPDWPAEDMFDHPAPSQLVKEKTKSEESLSDLTGSLLSLQLDLGPSFLDEVLNVMDKNK